jgi:hypothetical protein
VAGSPTGAMSAPKSTTILPPAEEGAGMIITVLHALQRAFCPAN